MKNDDLDLNNFKKLSAQNNSCVDDKIKTTDINILLNRIKIDNKKLFKQKAIFTLLLLSFTGFLGIFFFFQ
jgi:hypothetical protein